jgi:hypothetical protein
MTNRFNIASAEAMLGDFAARRVDLRDFIYAPEAPLCCCVCRRVAPSPVAACAAGWYYTADLRKSLKYSFYCPPCAELERV